MRSVAALLALALAGGALADESVLQMGRALYRGEREFSRAPRLNGVELSGMACIQCHGSEGAGLREGGVRAPALQWHLLMLGNPDGPGYADADAVLAAIRDGRGRAQRVLKAPMPRFALSADEGQALVAYLRQLSGRGDEPRGVTDERITVASVLPLSGPQAAVGRLVRSTLEQRFAALNADGGLFGRRIELVVVDAGDSPASASRAARDLLDSGAPPVFALVAACCPSRMPSCARRWRSARWRWSPRWACPGRTRPRRGSATCCRAWPRRSAGWPPSWRVSVRSPTAPRCCSITPATRWRIGSAAILACARSPSPIPGSCKRSWPTPGLPA
ncbi:hypothetical protein D0N87_08010 [Pseudomonas sp. ATCC 13867]|nr:hypothetical protein D0N87_08010 [Pseudomonas sp. ATCC 13867]